MSDRPDQGNMNILTPSRIFLALGLSCTGVLAMADAAVLPPWARFFVGAFGIFSGVLTAMSGPVQNSAAQNVAGAETVADMKAAEKK